MTRNHPAMLLLVFSFVLCPAAGFGAEGNLGQPKCSDLKKNPDGSWTNIRPISAAKPDGPKHVIELPVGLTFTEGNILDGLDIGGVLNARCQ